MIRRVEATGQAILTFVVDAPTMAPDDRAEPVSEQLLAIALVVGVLVDDAIVEIEDIVRHIRQSGKSAYDAAIDAADEIGLAVVATTFAIIVVLRPLD